MHSDGISKRCTGSCQLTLVEKRGLRPGAGGTLHLEKGSSKLTPSIKGTIRPRATVSCSIPRESSVQTLLLIFFHTTVSNPLKAFKPQEEQKKPGTLRAAGKEETYLPNTRFPWRPNTNSGLSGPSRDHERHVTWAVPQLLRRRDEFLLAISEMAAPLGGMFSGQPPGPPPPPPGLPGQASLLQAAPGAPRSSPSTLVDELESSFEVEGEGGVRSASPLS